MFTFQDDEFKVEVLANTFEDANSQFMLKDYTFLPSIDIRMLSGEESDIIRNIIIILTQVLLRIVWL